MNAKEKSISNSRLDSLDRRGFLKTSYISFAALLTKPGLLSSIPVLSQRKPAVLKKPFNKIILCENASLPHRTAAEAAAHRFDLPLEVSDRIYDKCLNIGSPEFADKHKGCMDLINSAPADINWDAFYQIDENGWIVTGKTPRSAAHAVLSLLDRLECEEPLDFPLRKIRKPVFSSLEMDFDDWSGGFQRMADGFDIEKHIADSARVGMTSFEVNLLPDQVPIQVLERRRWQDKYQWWSIYSPALDMFVESNLNRGTYHRVMLKRNLKKLKDTAAMARAWGLTPTFTAFEPRAWPERLYDHYPELRGARVDNAIFSAEPEYAPDVNHPKVIEHYSEMMKNLLEEVPDLGSLTIWSQDSCAGFPWAEKLYPGANGPIQKRKRPIEETMARFTKALSDSGKDINPDFEIRVCLSWFTENEQPKILASLPEEIGITYTAGSYFGSRTRAEKKVWAPIEQIRSFKKEPHVQVEEVSNPWKPFGPILGPPHPYLTFEMLCNIKNIGKVKDLSLRGGLTTDVFVPNFINNEVIREFQFSGEKMNLEGLLKQRAKAWTNDKREASILFNAWKLCDEALRAHKIQDWTLNFCSGRTMWRRLVRPVVPNQALLTYDDSSYFRYTEYNVGASDPGWVDHMYQGWSRRVRDDEARSYLKECDTVILAKLKKAADNFNTYKRLSDTSRDVRDRILTLYHVFNTDRNIMEVQERIHAALAENREHPEKTKHAKIVKDTVKREIENTRRFKHLIETSPSVLIPVSSGEETVFMIKAPLEHQLERKLLAMERHVNDTPGPWFEELKQPGGWTSDLKSDLY
ncbi:hypothetical protein ACFL40_04015 [candidate division KSB1 bacterium]